MEEQSRLEITNELRRFVEVEKHEAVKTGGQAQVQQGDLPDRGRPGREVDELTLREGRPADGGPQFVNKGVDGVEWVNLYCKLVEMNKEVNVRDPRVNSRSKTLLGDEGRQRKRRRRVVRPDQRATYRKSGRGSTGIVEALAEPGAGVD